MSIFSDLFKKKKDNNEDYSLDETACELIEYLECECEYIPPTKDTKILWEKYLDAYEKGKKEGFTPVFIPVDDALLETLLTTTTDDISEDDEIENENDIDFLSDDEETYREKLLSSKLEDGKQYLNKSFTELIDSMVETEGQDEINRIYYGESEDIVAFEDIEALDSFVGWKDFIENETYELILVKIPTTKPWEVFAWLPFGGWNECPLPKKMMSATKYWYKKYGAVTGLITQTSLDMYLPKPINNIDVALKIAEQHYGFCNDIVDQGCGCIKAHAENINNSTVWHFWWD